MIREPWYLLFDASSEDGWGTPKYVGRTLDKDVAEKHALKCDNNPYSIGKVMIITDTSEERMDVREIKARKEREKKHD